MNAAFYGNVISPDDRLFPSQRGGRLHESTLNRAIRKVCERQNINRFTTHSFRHTFVTNARIKNVPVYELKAVVGHSDERTTQNVYTHATDDGMRDIMLTMAQDR